jgi:virginiamycin B lyase
MGMAMLRADVAERLTVVAAVLAAVLSGPVAAAQADAPVGIAQSFATKCGVGDVAAGKEGNVWFTCFEETRPAFAGRPKIGRVTPAGQVSEFGAQLPKNEEAGEIVAAPDGNLWFTLNSALRLTPRRPLPPEIGRITPSGQVTTYPLPLGPKDGIGDLVAGPNGYLWFLGAGSLWQISPLGTIARLPIDLGQNNAITLEAGTEGNLWFARKPVSGPGSGVIGRLTPGGELSEFGATIPNFAPTMLIAAPDGSLLFFYGTTGPGVGRISPSGEFTPAAAVLVAPGKILGGAAIGADGNLWYSVQVGFTASAIGRVTASGQATEFNDCLRYSQPYFGPAELVLGADGNLWFTSLESRSLPGISDPPSIGRVTPSGEITQIFAGVNFEATSIVAGPDGAIWFSGGRDEIERIEPFSAPINTFHVGRTAKAAASGVTTLRLTVPGPGTIEAKPQALLLRHRKPVPLPGVTVRAGARACGAPELPLRPVGAAKRAFRKHDEALERIAFTFTPAGGTPYTETAKVDFHRPHPQR